MGLDKIDDDERATTPERFRYTVLVLAESESKDTTTLPGLVVPVSVLKKTALPEFSKLTLATWVPSGKPTGLLVESSGL